jgi:DNA-binding Lrp family transcriptional regulator
MAENIPPPFDTLDYQIIQALRRTIRADAAKIARAVDANERTVRKRIDRLVTLGALRLAAIINPRAFGYVTEVSVFLEVELEHEEEVLEQFLTLQGDNNPGKLQGQRRDARVSATYSAFHAGC